MANIKVQYKDGSVVLKIPKLNAKLEHRSKVAKLLTQGLDAETKQVKDHSAIAEWELVESKFFLDHIIEVDNLKDVDDTELTIDDVKSGDISTELYKALQDGYQKALEVLEADSEGK